MVTIEEKDKRFIPGVFEDMRNFMLERGMSEEVTDFLEIHEQLTRYINQLEEEHGNMRRALDQLSRDAQRAAGLTRKPVLTKK